MKSPIKPFYSLALTTFAISATVRAKRYKSIDEVLTLHRMPPNPNPYQVTYDDGTKSPLLRLKTREQITSPSRRSYEETLDGFTVKEVNGKYVYLEVDDNTGEFIETKLVAGVDDPYSAKIRKGAAERKEIIQPKGPIPHLKEPRSYNIFHRNLHEEEKDQYQRRTAITSGVLKNLVIPFKFSDHGGRNLPSRADLNTLMNNVGPDTLCPTGSVRDVYLENSFNQLDVQSTVIDWITIQYTEAYCADGVSATGSTVFFNCLIDALNKAVAAGVNFGDYDIDNDGYIDGITFFHSGYAAEFGGNDVDGTNYVNRIWSHKWAIYTTNWNSNGVRVFEYHVNPSLFNTYGSSIGRIGVVAHETGHFLGLPDLYDYGDGNGIGSYGLMANSWGFDNDQYYPPLFSAWSKNILGWVSPTVVSTSGSHSLGQSCDNAQMIMISKNFPSGEYLLIENRQPCGFDAAMDQGGLAIFHIDENANNVRGYPNQSGWPGNGNHYEVALLQADGDYDLEQGFNRGDTTDLFRAGYVSSIGPSGTSVGSNYPNTKAYQSGSIIDTDVTISNISAAGSTMTFDIIFGSAPSASPSEPQPTASPTQSPPTSATCGDNVCDVNEGEGCGSCTADCFFPTHCFAVTSNWVTAYYGSVTYGMVFDVQVTTSLYFYEIDAMIMPNVNTVANVYMSSTSYTADTNLNNWDLVFSGSIINSDPTYASLRSMSFDSRFYAAAGSTAAFYISYTSPGVFLFSPPTGDFSNGDVVVTPGNILSQQTGNTLPQAYYYNYEFVETIKYDYSPSSTPAPTPSPTSQPTPSPSSQPTPSPSSQPTPSPTLTPTNILSTPAPTSTPSSVPTQSPTSILTTPSPTISCKDSTLRLKIPWNGGIVTRSCTWVANKQTNMRCAVEGVSQACRVTCGTCSICADSTLRLRIPWNGRNVARYCTWVANKQTKMRCAVEGVADTCPKTCGVCS